MTRSEPYAIEPILAILIDDDECVLGVRCKLGYNEIHFNIDKPDLKFFTDYRPKRFFEGYKKYIWANDIHRHQGAIVGQDFRRVGK